MNKRLCLAGILSLLLGTVSVAVAEESSTLVVDKSTTAETQEISEPEVQQQDEFSDFSSEFEIGGDTQTVRKVFDPLIKYNRVMYHFNDKFYYWVARPAAKGYSFVMPKFARTSIQRSFQNILFPLRFVSSLLQFKMKKTGTELGRFVVNSTVGIGGMMDPAEKYLKWYQSDEDLGQVLGFYGVGDGFPLVLPIFGQANLRDSAGMIPAQWLNPVTLIADFHILYGLRTGERLNFISLHLGEYENMTKEAFDPYTYIRDAYKQRRDNLIKE